MSWLISTTKLYISVLQNHFRLFMYINIIGIYDMRTLNALNNMYIRHNFFTLMYKYIIVFYAQCTPICKDQIVLMIYRGPDFLAVIWLHPHPPPYPVGQLSLFLSLPVRRMSRLLAGEDGRGWGRSQIIRLRESLVLYKSFNTYSW